MRIELRLVTASPTPVRTTWEEEEMKTLTASMKADGQLIPILLRPKGDAYEIVAGHRRARAARRLGWTHIRAEVEDLTDLQAYIAAGQENLMREDLTPMDKARWLQGVKDRSNWSLREMARRGIMSQPRISRLLALLKEPAEIQELIAEEKLTEYLVREVRALKLREELYIRALVMAAEEGWDSDTAILFGKVIRGVNPWLATPEGRYALMNLADGYLDGYKLEPDLRMKWTVLANRGFGFIEAYNLKKEICTVLKEVGLLPK